MGSIDGLKEQVEELKQRLNAPDGPPGANTGELKTRLATIKASLEGKQQEIARLTAEKERLTAEKQRLTAEKEQFATEKQKFAAEMQRASSENEQLRRMLGDVLAVIDGQSVDSSTKILREFLAETDPLIKPASNGVKDAGAAGQGADQAATAPGRAAPTQAGGREHGAGSAGGAGKPDPDVAIPLGSDVDVEDPEEEESPALRRIMRRGRRAS
jgi:predicted nuclease with TOPRIM domain